MSDFTKTVTYAIVKAEAQTAHHEIRAVWDAYAAHDPEPISSRFAAAIERATSCLPPELRTPDMPAPVPYRTERPKPVAAPQEEFDDILG